MEQKQIYKNIDEILWTDWNPIGCVPRDEYQGYTPEIFKLKIEGADVQTITNKLYEFETINIGLSWDVAKQVEHCKNVAKKIVEL